MRNYLPSKASYSLQVRPFFYRKSSCPHRSFALRSSSPPLRWPPALAVSTCQWRSARVLLFWRPSGWWFPGSLWGPDGICRSLSATTESSVQVNASPLPAWTAGPLLQTSASSVSWGRSARCPFPLVSTLGWWSWSSAVQSQHLNHHQQYYWLSCFPSFQQVWIVWPTFLSTCFLTSCLTWCDRVSSSKTRSSMPSNLKVVIVAHSQLSYQSIQMQKGPCSSLERESYSLMMALFARHRKLSVRVWVMF